MLAKINHMLSTLQNPTEDFIKTYIQTSLEWQTRWNQKSTANKNYHEGGLKMPNFKNLILSLKAIWLRRLLKKIDMVRIIISSKTDLLTNGLNWFVQLAYST